MHFFKEKVLRSIVSDECVCLSERVQMKKTTGREGELACVDMKTAKAQGHRGRKTLEVIHRHRMAHQHIPLSLSHSQMPLNLSLSLTHTNTHLCKNDTHMQLLPHSLRSVGV